MRQLDSNNKPSPLPESAKRDILKKDLPYRIALVRDAIQKIPAQTMGDNQAFEAGAVAGRSLLSFLGISYDHKVGKLKKDQKYTTDRNGENLTDDVKVTDVGGRFVEIEELTDHQRTVLARFIHGVHKACAHFTLDSQHSLRVDNYKEAAPLIIELYESHMKRGTADRDFQLSVFLWTQPH
jgi:hypothetical protein